MADPGSGRRFLRPPSTVSVSRKSHSFNAADRNKIKDVKIDSETSGIPHPGFSPATQASLASGQSEWRSRSMNAKHSFTQGAGQQHDSSSPSKQKKRGDMGSVKAVARNGRPMNSPTHLVKVENQSRMTEPSGKQKLVKTKQTTKPEKDNISLRSASSASSKSYKSGPTESSRMARPSTKVEQKTKDSKLKTPPSKTVAKGKSGLIPPRATVSRSASNSSRSSTATTASPDRKSTKTNFGKTKPLNKPPESQIASKSSSSVLGRLRKKGAPSTTIPSDVTNGVTLKQAVPVKSPTEPSKSISRPTSSASRPLSSASSTTSEKRRGLVPPSKLGTPSYKSKNPASVTTKIPSEAPSNVPKQNPGIKSTFQRAFTPKEEKSSLPKSKLQTSMKIPSPATKRKDATSNVKYATEDSDVMIMNDAMETPKRYSGGETPKRYSGEESSYRRDRIDVKNLKNLLVRPYDNVRAKPEEPRNPPEPVLLNEHEMDFSDSEDISKASMDVDLPNGDEEFEEMETEIPPPLPEKTSTPMTKQLINENRIRNVQLPSSTEGRKPQKTATVAPFNRQVTNRVMNGMHDSNSEDQERQDIKDTANTEDGKTTNANSAPSQNSRNKTVSIEERRKTARGIADLRQNLEETMVSLRNSQLKNRLSDEFERRISAELDIEVEELGLPEVPPPLTSNGGYRSASTISGLHTISHSTRSPKLHAGECLGTGSYTSPRVHKYSSLQRTQSSRSARSVWNERTDKKVLYKDETEEISSVSSEDISELITGVSTDDISLSSCNNSPFHISKPASALPKKSSLVRNNKVNNSIESLEKSSNSTTESNRSLSAWKKTKSGSKSDSESKEKKKKAEKKSSIKGKKGKGSTAVGSRLAGADRSKSPSPTASDVVQPFAASRDIHSYRSLPRTKKLLYTDTGTMLSNLTPASQQNGQEGFVRSPALKILLRSKANKAKVRANLADTPDGGVTFNVPSSAHETDPSAPKSGFLTNGNLEKDFGKTDYYSSLERKNSRNLSYGLSMSATQSLPRRFARKPGSTTWSQPRSSANSAYSLPVTQDSLYDQYGSYIDSSVSCSESANSFSNLTVPEFDSFPSAMDRSFQERSKISDWPFAGLPQPSSVVAASSPNVARATYGDRNYRTISSTHDFKRRGSTLSLGAALSQQSQISDEVSIATARTFLYSLAQNSAVHQGNMVHDFEKSLSHLTSRLRELATNAEEKDSELKGLRDTIEKLKRQSCKSEDWERASTMSRKLKKKPSCASLSSMDSQASVSSVGSGEEKPKKKKGWLKSSFKSAFGRTKSKANLSNGETATTRSNSPQKSINGQEVASLSSFDEESCDPETVRKLKEELRQKERKLTDIRLEALTSRHQLQHLQDTMNQMKTEMESLRKENEQLQQLGLSAYSLTSSSTFLHSKLSNTNENIVKSVSEEMRIKIMVEISNFSATNSNRAQYIFINICPLSRSITWSHLDQKLTKIFMAYCQTVDPTNCMKLNKTSIDKYTIGEGEREIGAKTPDLLPCGYLVGDTDTIVVKLQDGRQNCVDSLAFELLIDKTIAEKYVDLILERQRVIICGPVGTGKTLLANRLAGYVAEATDSSEPVIYMDAKQKALSELQDFLQNVASATRRNIEGNTIIVLDNLQSVKSPQKLLEPFAQSTPMKGLYLICVTNRKTSSGLEEFCWITCNNNSPPVQTFLARKLRRAYLEHQISQNQKPDDILSLVITWLPKCWQHINDFLELHSGSEVTIGPRMFSSCPMDASSARVWFTDLWNFSVVPYVISAVKRSTTRRNSAIHCSDPTDWVLETMPWRQNAPNLLHIRGEDIGPSPTESDHSGSIAMSLSSGVTSQSSNASQSNSDPLLNMLMRLQEAANYDSDTNSSHDENFEISIDKALTELGS